MNLSKREIFIAIVGMIIGILVIMTSYAFMYNLSLKSLELLKVFSSLIVFFALIVAILQLDFNKRRMDADHDWNRRSYTITYLGESIEKIQEVRKELNELTSKIKIKGEDKNILSFSDRFLRADPLTEEEVHNWICEWKNGEFVKEKSDGDQFKLTEEGDKIRILLITLLNIYESIGSGLQNRVLDEDVIRSLMKGPIIANYNFFILYIKHIRNKHKAKNAGKNFRFLHKKINPKKTEGQRAKTEDV